MSRPWRCLNKRNAPASWKAIAETNSDCEITLATFGGKAKKAGYMEATETIRDVSIEKLRVIHENRLAIAKS